MSPNHRSDSKKQQKAPRGLNDADRKFIETYLKTGNATEAYYSAGFNGRNAGPNAYKMLNKANIQAFLAEAKKRAVKKVAKKLEITVDKVLEDLEEARITALNSHPSPQCAAAIKASELQGKHIGMFRDDFAERDQMPMVIIRSGDGSQVMVVGGAQEEALAHKPAVRALPDTDIEALTDDDLL